MLLKTSVLNLRTDQGGAHVQVLRLEGDGTLPPFCDDVQVPLRRHPQALLPPEGRSQRVALPRRPRCAWGRTCTSSRPAGLAKAPSARLERHGALRESGSPSGRRRAPGCVPEGEASLVTIPVDVGLKYRAPPFSNSTPILFPVPTISNLVASEAELFITRLTVPVDRPSSRGENRQANSTNSRGK